MSFDYSLDYKHLDLRKHPELYRVGKGEQGVLMVEPYRTEIVQHWRFRTPEIALQSAHKIYQMYLEYKEREDFVGMDMARKFLQMGFTRSRRYANHASGRKYNADGTIRPQEFNEVKARSAEIFYEYWQRVEQDLVYQDLRAIHKAAFG